MLLSEETIADPRRLQRGLYAARRVLLLFAASLLLGLGAAPVAGEEMPSVRLKSAALVSPANAWTFYGTSQVHTDGATAWATVPPEVQAVADGLGAAQVRSGDLTAGSYADRVAEYVRTNIDIEFRFGLGKGARGAILDQSGTAFDQAQLMMAMLRHANVPATYQLGTITLNAQQFGQWTGLVSSLTQATPPTLPTLTVNAQAACQFLADGGIPATVNSASSCSGLSGNLTTATLGHLWIMANGKRYDPAFKRFNLRSGIDLAQRMGCGTASAPTCATTATNALMIGSVSGTLGGAQTLAKLSTSSLDAQLRAYAVTLQQYIQANLGDADLEDVVGGRLPDNTSAPTLPTSTLQATWSGEIPDQFRTRIGLRFNAVNPLLFADELYGKRIIWLLTLENFDAVFTGGPVSLVVENTKVAEDPALVRFAEKFQSAVDHPYAANGGTYADESRELPFLGLGGQAVFFSLGNSGAGLAKFYAQREREVPGSDYFVPVGPEFFQQSSNAASFVASAQLLHQESLVTRVIEGVSKTRVTQHHAIGTLLGGTTQSESGSQTFSMESTYSVAARTNDAKARLAAFGNLAGVTAMMESSVAQQLQDSFLPIGTAGIFGLANSQEIPFIDVTADTVTAVLAQLEQFSPHRTLLPPMAANSYQFIIPQRQPADSFLNPARDWFYQNSAVPLLSYRADSIAYLIGDSIKGGGAAIGVDDPIVQAMQGTKPPEKGLRDRGAASVNLATGDLTLTAAPDLVTGVGEFPYSLSFQRVYSSAALLDLDFRNFTRSAAFPALEGGWVHNYQITASLDNDGASGLGVTRALDAANAIAALYTFQDLWTVQDTTRPPDFRRRLTGIFTTNWLSQRFINNAVTLRRGLSTTVFVRLPNGEFAAPRASADRLAQTGTRVGPLCAALCKHNPPRNLDERLAYFPETSTAYDYGNIKLVYTDASGATIIFIPGEEFTRRIEELSPGSSYPKFSRPEFVADTWQFPQGVQLSFSYELRTTEPGGTTQRRALTKVANNLGRSLSFEAITDVLINSILVSVKDENDRKVTFTSDSFKAIDFAVACGSFAGFSGTLLRCTAPDRYTVTTPDGVSTVYDYTLTGPEDNTTSVAGYRLNAWFTPDDAATPFLTFEYDSAYRARAIVDRLGRRSTFKTTALFGSEQVRGEILDPLAALTTQYFNRDGNVVATIDPLLRETYNTYDAAGRLASTTLPEKNKIINTYDSRSNRLTTREVAKPGSGLADIVTSATYPAGCIFPKTCNLPTSSTDARGQTTTHTYDNNTGQILTTASPSVPLGTGTGTPLTTFCYTSFNTSTGPLTLLTGRIDKVDAAVNRVSLYVYDSAKKFVLARGVVDPDPTLAPPASSSPTCLTPAKSTALKLVTEVTFDNVGNLSSVDGPRSGSVDLTTYRFDPVRRVTRATAPLGEITRFEYLPDGLLSKTHRAQVLNPVDSNPADWLTETRAYHPTAELRSVTDPQGSVTSYLYDAVGRQTLETDPEGISSGTVYDRAGQTLCLWEGLSGTSPPSNCTWDPASYVAGGALRYAAYSYTTNGKRSSIQDANNNTTAYAYDGFDRSVFTLFADPATGNRCSLTAPITSSSTPTCSADQTYEKTTYDADGNRLSLRTRRAQLVSWTYDNLDRIITKQAAGLPLVTYAHNLVNEVMSVTSPASGNVPAHSLSYAYDGAGRRLYEQNLLNGTQQRVSYQYDPAGNRQRITWPDGYFVSHEHDGLNRLTTVWEGAVGNIKLADYEYDVLSRRKQLRYAGTAGNQQSYSYEADSDLDVLTHAMNAVTLTFDHGYNKSGQVTSIAANDPFYLPNPSVLSTAYVPDKLNRYTSVGGQTNTYDNNGNLLTWFPAGGKHTYTYDSENRLRSAAVNGSATATITYDYDDLNRRLAKTVGGVSTYFVLDGNQEIAELSSSGVVLRRYIAGAGVDERIAVVEGAGLTNPPKTYYHVNHQGSVIALTDGAGNATGCAAGLNCQRLAYDEFGRLGVGAATGQPYRYTGKRFDEETGLYYYQARYYAPELGRFLQTDPVGVEDDVNLYSYVGNDPVSAVDPSGEARIPLRVLIKNGLVIRNASLAGKLHPVTKVPFNRKGFPIFDKYATHTIRLKEGFKGNAIDFAKANKKAGLKSTGKNYTWHHHQDGHTLQRVPRRIHDKTGHTGGMKITEFGRQLLNDPSFVGGLIYGPLGLALYTSASDPCNGGDLGCEYQGKYTTDPDTELEPEQGDANDQVRDSGETSGVVFSIDDEYVTGIRCTGRLDCRG